MADSRQAQRSATASSGVRFVLDHQVIDAVDAAPTTTVLEYLRETLGRTGTKEGCAEGDCGACTVVIGELNADGTSINYRAINSCIRYLPTIDGMELVTAESLESADALHPVQQSMVDHHASQCGFCTPGFVMSLFALYLSSDAPARDEVIDTLAGNLCRCTGYRPIIDAGLQQATYPSPARWSRDDSQSPERVAKLKALQRSDSLLISRFKAPLTIAELADALVAAPDSLILAGGTDIGLWTTKQLRELPPIVYLGNVRELCTISQRSDALTIGAAVTLSAAWRAIVGIYPALSDLAQRFASPPVCNSGTLCGNIANGSPVGDSMPILLVLNAQIELRHGSNVRTLPLDQFYLGYQRKDLRPGEFVVNVQIPLPRAAQRIASYKVSKRFDQDIAAVCAAFAVELDGERVTSARIAFGGMAATPARAMQCESALVGKPWNAATIETAIIALASDFKPLSDMRASATYRQGAAASSLRRFFQETGTSLRVHGSELTARLA